MSHSNGAARFNDGRILFLEYSGTSGCLLPKLYETLEEAEANWRVWEWAKCSCGKDETCVFYATYGTGCLLERSGVPFL